MRDFVRVLKSHLYGEFEVNIVDGRITERSVEVLKHLESEFEILQYRENVQRVFSDEVPLEYINCLEPVKEELISLIEVIVSWVSSSVMKTRRSRDNKLCKEKCQTGPELQNFTTSDIPETLKDFLKDGLKNVPRLAAW